MQDFQELLDELDEAADRSERVSVADVRAQIGTDAFGSAILVLGLILLSPVGGIPGLPTIHGILFVLVAGQLTLGRDGFWLPGFLLRRSLKADHVKKAVRVSRPVARVVGKVVHKRMAWLASGAFARAIGVVCALLALCLPPLEIVPFGALVPAVALTAFGLALVARDGLVAILGLAATFGSLYAIFRLLL